MGSKWRQRSHQCKIIVVHTELCVQHVTIADTCCCIMYLVSEYQAVHFADCWQEHTLTD